jgi:hypothetical protein
MKYADIGIGVIGDSGPMLNDAPLEFFGGFTFG